MRERSASILSSCLIAIIVAAIAVGLRWLSDRWLGDQLPLVTMIAAVAAAVWYGGYRPALLAAALGYLGCAYLFMAPRGSFFVAGAPNIVESCAYVVFCSILIGFGEAMRRAHRQRRAHQELQRSERELADFFDNANVSLHWVGPDGIILRANKAELDLLGYGREEYEGRHISEIHADQSTLEEILSRLARGETVREHPAQLRCKDGAIRDVLVSSSVLFEDGEFVHTRCVTIDVTDHRRAQQAQALLAAVVETSDDAIVSKTLEGKILSWNAGAERLFGYTAAEVVGKPINVIIPPELQDEERSILERLRRGQHVKHFETVRVAKNGRRIDISLSVSPVLEDSGRIVGASKVARDISEHKRAEARLSESEEWLRLAMESADIGAWDFNPDNGELKWSERCKAIFGLPPDAYVDYQVFLDRLHPEDREATDRVVQNALAPTSDGRYEIDYRSIRPDGAVRWIVAKGQVFFEGAGARRRAVRFIGTVLDITDRKRIEKALREAEEQFRNLADNISQFAWMADAKGWIFWYNRRWYEYTGTTLEQMQGWGWKKVHHPDHVDRVVARVQHSWDTGEIWEDTFPLRGVDGNYRWFLSRALPIRDAQGNVVRWFGTNTDVTEQRELEQSLRDADRRKDRFLATLAHELRNPLAPIRNAAQIIKEKASPEPQLQWAANLIDRQVEQMVRLLDDLLDVSRISHNKLELRKEPVVVVAIVQSAVETSRPLIDGNRHHLDIRLPDEPVHLVVDPVRMAQVFSNLLTNAAKYTDPGGRIQLAVDKEDGQLVVSVSDNGIGISATMLPRIFEMFSQEKEVLERSQGGLGIGLSLVQGIVELHGGSIQASSAGPNKGSRFVVRLQLDEEPNLKNVQSPGNDAEPAPAARQRLLIVDDRKANADSLAMFLQMHGYEVHTAYDGDEAITQAGIHKPDVVLLDIGMPTLNGYDACKCIRQQPWGKEMFLIAITGWGQDDDRRRSEEAGFDHHLVKPVDPDHLIELLSALPAASN